MRLSEYLEKNELTQRKFAELCKVPNTTIRNAVLGYTISLDSAIKIEEFTHSRVKCVDLKPTLTRTKKINDTNNE